MRLHSNHGFNKNDWFFFLDFVPKFLNVMDYGKLWWKGILQEGGKLTLWKESMQYLNDFKIESFCKNWLLAGKSDGNASWIDLIFAVDSNLKLFIGLWNSSFSSSLQRWRTSVVIWRQKSYKIAKLHALSSKHNFADSKIAGLEFSNMQSLQTNEFPKISGEKHQVAELEKIARQLKQIIKASGSAQLDYRVIRRDAKREPKILRPVFLA